MLVRRDCGGGLLLKQPGLVQGLLLPVFEATVEAAGFAVLDYDKELFHVIILHLLLWVLFDLFGTFMDAPSLNHWLDLHPLAREFPYRRDTRRLRVTVRCFLVRLSHEFI